MKIYVGGAWHGQKELCEAETGLAPVRCTPEAALTAPAVADFHLLIRDVLAAGGDGQSYARRLLDANPDAVLTCDEIGGGIVPLDPTERRWREEVGRALGVLTAADGVSLVRVWYGLGELVKAGRAPAGGGSTHREILLLRHGRTPGNEARRYNGTTDEPLSDAGRAALSEKHYAPVPLVYVTRLRRTRETAEILFPGAKQITVPGLREMDFGDFEGRSYVDMEHDAAYRAWVDSGCLGPVPNGERRADFLERIGRSFRALLASDRSERLTIVAHGGTLMAVCSLFVDPGRDYFDWQPRNGGGYLLRTRGDGPACEIVEELN